MNDKNHFKVPEGYFEQFHQSLMEQIERAPSKRRSIFSISHQWKYAAAIAAIFIMSSAIYLTRSSQQEQPYVMNEEYSNDFIDELLDSYPIDDYTFYTYLTSNEL